MNRDTWNVLESPTFGEIISSALADVTRELLLEHDPEVMAFVRDHGFPEDYRRFPPDPVAFMRKVLKIPTWHRLEEVADSVAKYRYTVVHSGHGVGKTFLAAALVAWWMCTRVPSIVVTIAPTWHQVANLLWRRIRSFANTRNLPGTVLMTPRWEIGPEHYAVGLSPRDATEESVITLQGYHAPYLLVILEEAAGLSRYLWEACEGLATGEHNRILAIGNPVEQRGPFWEAFHNPKWRAIRISCLEHPNVVSGEEKIPGAVSWAWVDEKVEKWCTPAAQQAPGTFFWEGRWWYPSPLFQARVLGIAPSERDDQLITIAWLELAYVKAHDPNLAQEPIVFGVDPARLGSSESVIAIRRGQKLANLLKRNQQTTQDCARWVAELARDYQAQAIVVDEVGVGAGVLDALKEILPGTPIFGFNGSRPAEESKRFGNARAEVYWRLRQVLQNGEFGLQVRDARMEADLTSMRYQFDHLGRITLEPKEQLIERLGHSPDAADALAMTFYAFRQPSHVPIAWPVEELTKPSPWGLGLARAQGSEVPEGRFIRQFHRYS